MTTIKLGKTWQDTMVQADMCLDNGDDAAAERWRLLGNVQNRLERLWTEGRNWDFTCVGSTFVRRERLASNPDAVFREVAERLVK